MFFLSPSYSVITAKLTEICHFWRYGVRSQIDHFSIICIKVTIFSQNQRTQFLSRFASLDFSSVNTLFRIYRFCFQKSVQFHKKISVIHKQIVSEIEIFRLFLVGFLILRKGNFSPYVRFFLEKFCIFPVMSILKATTYMCGKFA